MSVDHEVHMRTFLISVLLMLAALSARADEAAVQSVIQSQITAFEQDDFATAFTYASPSIRQMFGTSDRFGAMVRSGYPMVWRPAQIDFFPLKSKGNRTLQDVMITDQADAVHVLRYEMIETGDGWQINGVQLLRAPQVGA
jgi:hypothetical protein